VLRPALGLRDLALPAAGALATALVAAAAPARRAVRIRPAEATRGG
jgi:ABC-type lipoprotein release transport system permease subunit